MKLLPQTSPNCDERPHGVTIDSIVLHYTGMETGDAAHERLCDPAYKVSAHFIVHEDGEIVPLVPEKMRAWHAGVSTWRGRPWANDWSIGIEIVNGGHDFGLPPFPDAQIDSVIRLCLDIQERYPIIARNIIGHSDVAPDRKRDPGELFPWRRLAQEGVGVWPDLPPYLDCSEMDDLDDVAPLELGEEGDNILQIQNKLLSYGWPQPINGTFDEAMEAVVMAFQRHFVQGDVTGIWTAKENYILERLLWQVGESCA